MKVTRNGLLLYTPLDASRLPHARRLAELHPCVILMHEDTVKSLPSWITPLIQDSVIISRRDVAGSVGILKQYCEEDDVQLDGIISLSETGLYFCSHVARAFGLPFVAPDLLVRARDKSLMRKIFQEHQIPSIPFGVARNLEEGRATARRIGYPIILKPLLAGAKLYVRRVNSEPELESCFDEYLTGGIRMIEGDPLSTMTFSKDGGDRILIEKLIEGETLFSTSLMLPVGEVSVEGFVLDGQIHILGFHDKPLPANGPYYEEVLWSTPSRLTGEWKSALVDVAQRTIQAIGLESSFFHLEARTTAEGPVLLEVAARMGGGPIYRSIRESSGIDMMEIMFRIATARPVDKQMLVAGDRKAVMTFGIFAPEGMLKAVHNLDEVEAHPSVVEVALYDLPETYIWRAPKSTHCTVHVMVKADDFDRCEKVGHWATERIRFEMG
jgi:hypothetical protein